MAVIRDAGREDASRLAEILIFAKRTAYRPIFRDDMVSFGEMQVLPLALHYRDDPGALEGVLVYEDGFVKGMARLTAAPEFELQELYVDPFFQGAGVGGQLLEAVLDRVRQAQAHSIFLWVLEQNERARRFYEFHGFRPTGQRELEPGTTAWLLRYQRETG